MRTRAWSLLTHYAELLGICAVGVTQPVLATFGDTPEQFVFRGATTLDIVMFSVLVAFMPAAVLWLPGALAVLTGESRGRVVHQLTVGLTILVALLQVMHALDVNGPMKALVAVVGAAGGAWLFGRVEGIQLWTRIMSVSALVFVGLFLFTSDAGDLAFAEPPDPVELVNDDGNEAPPALPDVVVIVLDEVPTALLLDDAGGIDAVRYPSLAAFAEDATWYRRHTTVSSFTARAVPALLSGQLPTAESGPVWPREPDNLFRLLGGTYHLSVSEAFTRLCPLEWCGPSPVAPPSEVAVEEPDEPPAAVVVPIEEPDRGRLSGLLGDAFDIWTDQIALEGGEAAYSGFEETVVVATTSTTEPVDVVEPADLPSTNAGEVSLLEEEAALEAWLGLYDSVGRIPRVEELRATIRPSPVPTLWFLHIVLPHAPYLFTETGARYAAPGRDATTSADWEETILTERVALQMQFTDGLIGDVLDDLRAAGVYDDAIVVLASDHGVDLNRTRSFRQFDGANGPELMVAPLLVKAPGQTAGIVSDTGVESVDLLPTLAEMIGVEIPWETDGESVLGRDPVPDEGTCEDVRRFIRFGEDIIDDLVDDTVDFFELCAEDIVPQGLAPLIESLDPADPYATGNLARLTPFPEVLATSWQDLDAAPSDSGFVLETPDVEGGSLPPTGEIEGRVDELGAQWVAVALDGVIAGISPVYDKHPDDDDDRADHFKILVPSSLLDEDGYDVSVATLERVGSEVTATELRAS